jgi:hypothetical protein
MILLWKREEHEKDIKYDKINKNVQNITDNPVQWRC